jgi:hypothetical protein
VGRKTENINITLTGVNKMYFLCESLCSLWFLFFTTEGTEERRGIVFSQPAHSIAPLSKVRLYFDRLWNQPLSSMLMILAEIENVISSCENRKVMTIYKKKV